MIIIRIIININLILIFLFNLINLNLVTLMCTIDKSSINEKLNILKIYQSKILKCRFVYPLLGIENFVFTIVRHVSFIQLFVRSCERKSTYQDKWR